MLQKISRDVSRMKSLRRIGFFICIVCVLALTDAAPTSKAEEKLVIRGRVLFPENSRVQIERGAKVTVELQDVSLLDAPAKVIAKGTEKASRFPIAFAIKYLPSQITKGYTYSINVAIRNKQNELLYINDVHIPIIPLGAQRTKFISVPVIRVKKNKPTANKTQWPELVGQKGEHAVKVIKKETGLTNVVTILEGSPVTLDYSTSRVRVIVNNKGIVTHTPIVG
ncbi:unnamed protein product [Adineta ricciae]|uniref:Uncharacterized protein n=2 Tax=Adineta ricciae TaxID=249248 RepID=A0A814LBA1_ADIRI|nr:unnamed protein product [Adineta ricciae]